MEPTYAPRTCVPLEADLPVERPQDPPELVHLHDSAMQVFTDFASVYPVIVSADTTIDHALEKMKRRRVRLLIVVNRQHRVIGLISADQVMGEGPIRLAEGYRMDHSQISVAMLMQPREAIKVLELGHLRDARVGHIVATLHDLEQKYVLVVDDGAVCGLFSANQISRQLGRNILEDEAPAHSLAEMVHTLGQP